MFFELLKKRRSIRKFKDQEIEAVLAVICSTHNLKVSYTDKEINLIKHN